MPGTEATRWIGRCLTAGASLAGLALAACEGVEDLAIPPVQTWGFVSESFRTRDPGDEPRSYTNQVQVGVNADSYIWQPWFVTVESSLDLAYDIQRGGDAGSADSLLWSGGLALGALPFSQYPTRLAYLHTDSSVDGGFSGSDRISDRISITNRSVISSDLRTSVRASYEIADQPDFGDEEVIETEFGITKTFTTDRLSVNLSFVDEDFTANEEIGDIEDESETVAIARVTLDATPFENFNSQSTTTFIYEEELLDQRESDRYSAQGISTAQWRPADRPFSVNGALRTLTENIDVTGSGEFATTRSTQTNLANATVGLNYPIRDRLVANAGLNSFAQNISTEVGGLAGEVPATSQTTVGGSALGSINYISLPEEIVGFDWRWNASGNLNLTAESEAGLTDAETVTLGQTANRVLDTEILRPLRFSVSQEGQVQRTTEDGVVPSLFHNTSLTHSSSERGVATFVRLSASDRRDLTDDRDEFQLAQLQVNRRALIDLQSDWLASLSLQFSRQKVGDNDASTDLSANGTISYRERDVFAIPDLLFTSDLTLNAVGLEEILLDERDQNRSDRFRGDWRNKLEYRIGRIVTSLEGTIFFRQEELGNSIFFRIRRDFGAPAR